MGRLSTHPTTVEDCLILSIKKLNEWKYLTPNSRNSGSITVSRREKIIARYEIFVSTIDGAEYIEFDYTSTRSINDKREINYKVELARIPTNLGNAYRYYFLCPYTKKRCSKLYKPPNELYFLHREAYPYLIYEKQRESKLYRALSNSSWGLSFKLDELGEEIYKKNRKQYYKGKPTKLMQKYLDLEHKYNNIENKRIRNHLY